ncbi:polysaccharide deacetylase [Bacillus sp. REN10]|uniref:polysaccharide deacetylase n=1 Tax=Bacillus sp. REN10 TaxID=2782541 RepID=UPI00193BEC04|nr:polysaccharide deacetylase [Bacillus sp. REN10]
MKKWTSSLLFCVLVLMFAGSVSAAEHEKGIYLGLHDKMLPFVKGEAFIVDGQAVAPMAKLHQALYVKQSFNQKDGTYTLEKNGSKLVFNEITKEASFNGQKTTPAIIYKKNNEPYIGVHWVASHFGLKTDYLSSYQTVRIYSSQGARLSNEEFIQANQSFFDQNKPNPPSKKPIAYVTFDDGPNAYSASILNTLTAHKVKATFFYIEPNVRKYSEFAKRAAKEGHYLGLHSVTHQANRLYRSPQSFIGEMNQTQQTIKQVTGQSSMLIRAPYGSKPYLKQPYRNAMVQKGYRLWDWDVDSLDWKYSPSSKQRILQNIKAGIQQQKKLGDQHVVILMHEKQATADMLPSILDYLKKEGYELRAYNPSAHVTQNFWKDGRL